jgi:hypothetical protein
VKTRTDALLHPLPSMRYLHVIRPAECSTCSLTFALPVPRSTILRKAGGHSGGAGAACEDAADPDICATVGAGAAWDADGAAEPLEVHPATRAQTAAPSAAITSRRIRPIIAAHR